MPLHVHECGMQCFCAAIRYPPKDDQCRERKSGEVIPKKEMQQEAKRKEWREKRGKRKMHVLMRQR